MKLIIDNANIDDIRSMYEYFPMDGVTCNPTILAKEKSEGLKGHLMLFHAGTSPERTDKFYARHLDLLITELQRRGYRFVSLRKALR